MAVGLVEAELQSSVLQLLQSTGQLALMVAVLTLERRMAGEDWCCRCRAPPTLPSKHRYVTSVLSVCPGGLPRAREEVQGLPMTGAPLVTTSRAPT